MIRYFISYEEFIKNSGLDDNFNIHNPKLKLFKKNKNGDYRIDPIIYFNGYIKDIDSFHRILENSKKGMFLMVELNGNEIDDFNPLYIKKYNINNNILEKDEINSQIKLINYNTYINMNLKEVESGFLVYLSKVGNNYSLNIKKDKFIDREKLLRNSVKSDVYFYTTDSNVLKHYENDIILLKEEDINTYKIEKHNFIAIDSIPQTQVCDLSGASIRYLYKFCNSSIPMYIEELDNGEYEVSSKVNRENKKIYMAYNIDLKNIIYDPTVLPLLKYINIYELDNVGYKRINIEEYMKRENILKYIKKPSKN